MEGDAGSGPQLDPSAWEGILAVQAELLQDLQVGAEGIPKRSTRHDPAAGMVETASWVQAARGNTRHLPHAVYGVLGQWLRNWEGRDWSEAATFTLYCSLSSPSHLSPHWALVYLVLVARSSFLDLSLDLFLFSPSRPAPVHLVLLEAKTRVPTPSPTHRCCIRFPRSFSRAPLVRRLLCRSAISPPRAACWLLGGTS